MAKKRSAKPWTCGTKRELWLAVDQFTWEYRDLVNSIQIKDGVNGFMYEYIGSR